MAAGHSVTHTERTISGLGIMSSESRHTGPFITPGLARGTHGIGIDQLSFAYQTTAVFRDLCLKTEGRITVLRGPSGCGKTTLLKLFSGFLRPTSGLIQPAFRMPVLISQEDALFPWLTGLQNILKIAGVSLDQLKRSPLYPRIEGFIGQRAYQMSFGQRRLIEITRALLIKPDLLCLDEPFNFVDPASRTLIQGILSGSFEDLKETIILVSSHYDSDFSVPGVTDVVFDGTLPVRTLVVSRRL
jgi:ABC-type nitrate/sulfonate/bicarbonate transport system ATPase subunit